MLASRQRWCATLYEAFHSRALQSSTCVLRCSRPNTQRGCEELKIPWGSDESVVVARARRSSTGSGAANGDVPGLQCLPELAADLLEVETTASAAISTNERVLIAIDPDNSGAIAIAKLSAGSSGMRSLLLDTDVSVRDMPCLRVSVGKRQRRQADPAAVVEIVRHSLSSFEGGSAHMHCILEEPVPNPANGRQSVFGTGYAFGVWSGVLSASGISLDTVTARRWKSDLGLNKCGKDGSRVLAAALFPRAESLLRRKKDHGRAEALLILAWALGLRLPKTSASATRILEASGLPVEAVDSAPESSSEEEVPGLTEATPGIAANAVESSHILPTPGLAKGGVGASPAVA